MWDIIGAAALLGLGFAGILVLGIVLAHLGQRAWVMVSGGYGWADAGALMRAKYRRKHGTHRAEPGWQGTGMTDDAPGPAYKRARSGAGIAARMTQVADAAKRPASPELTRAFGSIAAAAQNPATIPVVQTAGHPPWEDPTHNIPVVPPQHPHRTGSRDLAGAGTRQVFYPSRDPDVPGLTEPGPALDSTETFARPDGLFRRDLDDPDYDG